MVLDLARNDTERQILSLAFARNVMGRPFVAPPSVPADRVEALRKAFMEAFNDPALRAEAEKAQLEINPVPGGQIQKIVLDAYATPPDIVKKTGDILKGVY
mgnify:FL=1